MSVAYSFAKDYRGMGILNSTFLILTFCIGGSGGERTNSPSPDAYNPDKAMRIVKEVSPEWR
jgi:hypothetical protein